MPCPRAGAAEHVTRRRHTLPLPVAAVERVWHISDSPGRFPLRSVNIFRVVAGVTMFSPYNSTAVERMRHMSDSQVQNMGTPYAS